MDDFVEVTTPQPIQIVRVGGAEENHSFTLNEEILNSILMKAPKNMKVSVVSVVGAFRTGKSFLLSWFLRYLSSTDGHVSGADMNSSGGDPWYGSAPIQGDGFHWMGGSDRDTTGIWMWSEPFVRQIANGEKVAMLLVDTQGMFDHETTMGLTAAIFGLSTLLSSFQIYNVDKRIQEDNLQQLALFSEYGRMALVKENTNNSEKSDDDNDSDDEYLAPPSTKPFQRIEFVVRDWQNFDDETNFAEMRASMDSYLNEVIRERDARDLQETREQITSCFDKISCYLMTHPGFAVTKKTYDGDVDKIDGTFLKLLTGLCDKVFGDELEAKHIHGRFLTALELGEYIKAYAKMFKSGAEFPEATTMLAATAEANNKNAMRLAVAKYKSEMERVSGGKNSNFLKPEEFEEHHRACFDGAIGYYETMANFGAAGGISEVKGLLESEIEESMDMYKTLNESRNPMSGMETYFLPLMIGFMSFLLRWVADLTCSGWSDTCKAGSDFFAQIYSVVFIFMVIVGFTRMQQCRQYLMNMKAMFSMVSGNGVLDMASVGGGKKRN